MGCGSEPEVQTQTSTQSHKVEIPEWALEPLKRVVSRAEDLSNTPYQDTIQDLSPDEIAAFDLIRQNAGKYLPHVDEAIGANSTILDRLLGGVQTSDIQSRMNPYLNQVLDSRTRLAEENFSRREQDLGNLAAGAGAYGGSRLAVAERELGEDYSNQLSDIQANELYNAFNAALGQYNLENQQGLAAGHNLTNLAAAGQGQITNQASLLQMAGQQERAIDQARADAEKLYPYQQLQFLQGSVLPAAGLYQSQGTTTGVNTQTTEGGGGSMFGNILGAGLSIAGMATGNPFLGMAGNALGGMATGTSGSTFAGINAASSRSGPSLMASALGGAYGPGFAEGGSVRMIEPKKYQSGGIIERLMSGEIESLLSFIMSDSSDDLKKQGINREYFPPSEMDEEVFIEDMGRPFPLAPGVSLLPEKKPRREGDTVQDYIPTEEELQQLRKMWGNNTYHGYDQGGVIPNLFGRIVGGDDPIEAHRRAVLERYAENPELEHPYYTLPESFAGGTKDISGDDPSLKNRFEEFLSNSPFFRNKDMSRLIREEHGMPPSTYDRVISGEFDAKPERTQFENILKSLQGIPFRADIGAERLFKAPEEVLVPKGIEDFFTKPSGQVEWEKDMAAKAARALKEDAGKTEQGAKKETKKPTRKEQKKIEEIKEAIDPVKERFGNVNLPLLLAGIAMMKDEGDVFDNLAAGFGGFAEGKELVYQTRKDAAKAQLEGAKTQAEIGKILAETGYYNAEAKGGAGGGYTIKEQYDDFINLYKEELANTSLVDPKDAADIALKRAGEAYPNIIRYLQSGGNMDALFTPNVKDFNPAQQAIIDRLTKGQ